MSAIFDKDGFYPDRWCLAFAVRIRVRVVVGVLFSEGFEECRPGVLGIVDDSPDERDEYLVPVRAD